MENFDITKYITALFDFINALIEAFKKPEEGAEADIIGKIKAAVEAFVGTFKAEVA